MATHLPSKQTSRVQVSDIAHVVKQHYKSHPDNWQHWDGSSKHYTRKDFKSYGYGHNCNPGKKNKKIYNRWLRNSQKVPFDLKNNEWKKLPGTDLWNWC